MSAAHETVVVTGIGAHAGGSRSSSELYAMVLAGHSPAEWVSLAGVTGLMAAVVASDPILSGADLRRARSLDRAAQLALAATRQAADQAGISGAVDPTRVGVMMGTSRGPITRTLETALQFATGRLSASASADSTPGSISGLLAQVLKAGGPSATVVATCASGATAIALGALHLLADEADAVIVGGADAPVIPLIAAQLMAAGVTGRHESPELTCRPYDVRRNGLVIGEGAAAMVLERESDALRRGASILARLTGWATGTDSGGRTGVTPDGDGMVRVVRRALQRAEVGPDAIDHVNAHGTGTRLNDLVEGRALNTVFGNGRVPPVCSTKPITGHCLGATAALEAVIAIETLRGGCIPPTANHEELDPEIDLDVVAGEPRPASLRRVLSTSLGFWGTQAAVIFERYD